MTTDPIDAVLARLENPKRARDNQWEARCPAHPDRNPSLGISIGRDGQVLLHCQAGCSLDDVLRAIDLTPADLWPEKPKSDRPTIVCTYPYHDADGTLVYEVVRMTPKTFRQRRPDGRGGWVWNLEGVERVLYRLPIVTDAAGRGERIWICEGEKDVATLEQAGVVATTNAGGAGKWRDSYTQALGGAVVTVVADADAPGHRHAREVARALDAEGCDVTLVQPAEGKDATDHFAAGHGLDDFEPIPFDEPERVAVEVPVQARTNGSSNGNGKAPQPEHPGIPPHIAERLWDDDARPPIPTPDLAMFHGPAGRFAVACAEHTEASPAAIYAHALTFLGVLAGRGPHFYAGNKHHPAAIFSIVNGESAKAGKGTAAQPAKELLAAVDPTFAKRRIMRGFGSGEALIQALDSRDPKDPTQQKAHHDERLIIIESEFGGLLSRAKREGSTVSAVLRDAWDGEPLERRIVTSTTLVENYHLAVVGHITTPELQAKLGDSELWGGFANRFLFWSAQRTQLLPDGGNVPDSLIKDAAADLKKVMEGVRHIGRMERTPAASTLWDAIYRGVETDDPPGVLGQIISRGRVHTLRLSLLLALLDGRREIDEDHVGAAYLIWQYCRASAAHIFGERLVDPKANAVLEELRRVGEMGATTTELLTRVWRKHSSAEHRTAVMEDLERRGLIAGAPEGTQGREAIRYWAVRPSCELAS